MAKSRRRWGQKEKADVVRRFLESGLSQKIFAEKLAIHPGLLAKWIRLDRDGRLPDPTPVLLPVRVPAKITTGIVPLEVVLSNGRRVRVPVGFDEDTLGRVLEVLERC